MTGPGGLAALIAGPAARIRDRPSSVKAAPHRAPRDGPAGAGPDPGDLCGPAGRQRGQAQACPRPERAASPAISPGQHRHPGPNEAIR